MAWKHKRTVDTTTSYPTGMPTYSRIGSMVKQIMNASQYDYHESEAFEVKEVILNEPGNRGSVRGNFINNPTQVVLSGVVKPLMPNVIAVPVIGEHVVVVEYNGQHYYTSIINRKGSVNENSIPGASGTYTKDTQYGETFQRQDIKSLEIGEGCILWEGRFGQSIHFGKKDKEQKPQIKIVAGHRGTTENIDKDDSSIYLSGASLKKAKIEDKKIQIKSNSIFINGENINLNSDNIKLGNDAEQPVVKGDELVKLLDRIVQAISTGANAFTTETTAGKTIQGLLDLLPDTKNILSKKVKTT